MADLERHEETKHTFVIDETGGSPSAHNSVNNENITRITHDDEYITFGNERYAKAELAQAFGGTLNPGLSPPPKNNLANAAPLGLSAFALSVFVLSLINCHARGVTTTNVVVSLAFFYGGAAQFLAGMFELGLGNSFGGLALSLYGAFWCSWAAFQVPSFGIAAAYADVPEQLNNVLGLFLIGWFIFTFFITIMTIKSTVAFFTMFALLTMTFLLLAIAEFLQSDNVQIAGGVFGLLTAFSAWYNAYAGIANSQNTYLTVKAVQIPEIYALSRLQ